MKNMFNVTTVLPHNLLQTNPCIRHNFSTQVFRKRAALLHYVGPELRYIFWPVVFLFVWHCFFKKIAYLQTCTYCCILTVLHSKLSVGEYHQIGVWLSENTQNKVMLIFFVMHLGRFWSCCFPPLFWCCADGPFNINFEAHFIAVHIGLRILRLVLLIPSRSGYLSYHQCAHTQLSSLYWWLFCQVVNWPESEAEHLHSSGFGVKSIWCPTCTLSYVWMARC